MFKNLSYLWLALAIMALQIFLIDELSIAMWLRPMIFPLVVILLQMEWRPIWVLLISTLVGVTMDLALGGAGLYTATIVPLAMIRRWIMYITTKRSIEQGDQTSLLSRLSSRNAHHTPYDVFHRRGIVVCTPLTAHYDNRVQHTTLDTCGMANNSNIYP